MDLVVLGHQRMRGNAYGSDECVALAALTITIRIEAVEEQAAGHLRREGFRVVLAPTKLS